MRTRELTRQHQKLEWLLKKTKEASGEDLELQAHWARYVCVRAAGFMENALGEVYSEYARRCGNTKVSNFVSASVSSIQNPKAQRFLDTAGQFSREWSEELEAFLDQNGRRDAVNSIMANRHLIAHGQDSGITIVRVTEYLEKCIEVIEFIETQCGV